MKPSASDHRSTVAVGLLAGVAGTLAMMAMRKFDQRYAAKTIPASRGDPARAAVKHAESAVGLAGKVPPTVESAKALTLQLGYGALAGAGYGLVRGCAPRGSTLPAGAMLGAAIYAVGYAGWLPLLGFTRPIWRQTFPEIAGEVLRHVAFGVTTAVVYKAVRTAAGRKARDE